jgi:hypothetical protein
VRLYDGGGNILASATLNTGDAQEGSPIPFYTQAITPVSLAAGQTYYIAQDTQDSTTEFYGSTDGPSTSPLITYGSGVSGFNNGSTPTSDNFGGQVYPSYFGPNFDASPATAVTTPEPATLASALTATAFGLAYAWRRKRAG